MKYKVSLIADWTEIETNNKQEAIVKAKEQFQDNCKHKLNYHIANIYDNDGVEDYCNIDEEDLIVQEIID